MSYPLLVETHLENAEIATLFAVLTACGYDRSSWSRIKTQVKANNLIPLWGH